MRRCFLLLQLATALNRKGITELHVGGNKIGNDGAAKLATSLETNTAVTRLQLWENDTVPKSRTNLALLPRSII